MSCYLILATVAPADQVAFYAYLSASTAANLPSKHILVFDHVVLNKGQGYHQDDVSLLFQATASMYLPGLLVSNTMDGHL